MDWLHHPCLAESPQHNRAQTRCDVAHEWVAWLHHPCPMWRPNPSRACNQIISGPHAGLVASPLPSFGVRLTRRRQWDGWRHHLYRLGGPQPFGAGEKIRSGPRHGRLAITLTVSGSPTLQSGGLNQKWSTSGHIGYITPAVLGSPTLQSGGQNENGPYMGGLAT